MANSNTNSNLEKITLRLAHVILGDTGKIRTPNSSSLKSDVSQVLEITDFVESDSLEHCLRTVRENYGIKSNFILNEEGNSLRAVVNNGQSFIGVSIPHENEFLSFGVLVAKTDLIENEAVEVVLKVLGALHLSRLTEAAAREERALNQQRLALANLASQVAHDIRSPLSALSMLTSLAVELPEDKRNLMRNATQRINDIANSLLNRGRVGELKSSIVSEPPRRISILNLVDSILSEKRLQVTGKSRIEIVAPVYYPYGLFVFVPVIEMKRALSNLLNNAIEAIASEGLIKLEVTSEGSSVQIKIRDNGVGMPAEILEKLGRQSVSHGKGGDQSGFGLGLPHAYETVRCAGGEIEVFSRLAEGTQVNVKLPKVDPPSWHLPHLDLKAKRVFAVVDDDVSIQDSWRRRLRSLNCPVKFMGFSSIDELAIWFHGQGESARESLIISMDYEFIGSVETGLDGIRRIGLQDVAFLVTSRCEEEEISREATNLRIPVVSKRDINLIPISF